MKHGLIRRRAAQMAGSLILALAALASEASAEESSRAKDLYVAAAERMERGEHAEACPMLEESRRLDPRLATREKLAECYAHTARPASAWSLYREVAAEAERKAVRATDERISRLYKELALRARGWEAKLEPALPMITIKIEGEAAKIPGIEVRLDGELLEGSRWGKAVPVDLGEHTVSASATGRAPWSERAQIDATGASVVVPVPALKVLEAPKPPAPRPPPTDPTAYLLLGALTLTGVAVGTSAGLMAMSKFDAAHAKCPSGCEEGSFRLTVAQSYEEAARSAALVSTAGFVAGGAALAGLVVYALWPSPTISSKQASVRITAGAGGDGAGVLLLGTF